MDLNLHGHTLSTMDYGYTVGVHTEAGDEIRIEETYTVLSPDGTATTHTPTTPVVDSGPLDILRQQTITAASADHHGTLRLTVTDGTQLYVPASTDYEAWTLTEKGGRKLVCRPRGELAAWSATET